MTDFTLSSGSICRPYRSPWGAFPTRTMGISTGVSSATIYLGSAVTLDYLEAGNSSVGGYVKRSTADNTFYLVGIAAATVSGSTATTGSDLPIWECNPLVEFKAVTKGATLQSSAIGLTKTLHFDSTLNIQYVDLTASTAADHRVVLTGNVDAQGDSGGYVSFRFIGNRAEQGSTVLSSTPFLAFYRA